MPAARPLTFDRCLQMSIANIPDGFSPFRSKVEAKSTVRDALPPPARGSLPLPAAGMPAAASFLHMPTLYDLGFGSDPAVANHGSGPAASGQGSAAAAAAAPEQDARGVFGDTAERGFRGGETQALARLQHYVWGTDALRTYFETRNGLVGADYSTKFSPWLSLGCLSPRTVHAE